VNSMKSLIHFDNCNLHYCSSAYQETSLRAYIFRLGGWKCSHPVRDIHALKDINVRIDTGEKVGLIGHNGAGKSTLLKAIAGLYPISSGNREVRGTIRSLLELSLGFEPDATGFENIMYRGLLLGQTPKQIRQLREEIIDFSELGEFINYPIRTYSAGMLVRLAFSISTSIRGDILLLDEIMSAGDIAFQQKARNRINALIDRAEILVFASHDLETMRGLCTRGLVLNHGTIIYDGNVEDALACYQDSLL